MRSALARPVDWLTAFVGVPVLVLVGRLDLAHRSAAIVRPAFAAAGLVVANDVARTLAARLEYHQTSGDNAADALSAAKVWRAVAVAIALSMVALSATFLLLDRRGVSTGLAGAGVGLVLARLTAIGAPAC